MSKKEKRDFMTGESEQTNSDWKKFLKKHRNIVVAVIIAGVLAFAAAIYVFWWFVGDAQSTGLVPSTLAQWTMANLVFFILHAIFWELILIGIPVAIGAVAGWQWWKRLPDEEKKEYRFFGKRSKTTGGGGGASALFFIAFVIKIYVDGNWNVAMSTWTINYVVGSMIAIIAWAALILGIPAAIVGIWWLGRQMKKTP